MDSLVYRYQGGGSDNHKLIRVEDAVTGDKYAEDIGPGQTGMNYRYDRSGNLIRDEQEKMSLLWDASGKLEKVERRPTNKTWTTAEYTYDAGGNRVRRVLRWKDTINPDVQMRTTFYVYDASGTVVSIYERECNEPTDVDGDAIVNHLDNCMYTYNPDQADTDGDGVGDACDLCPGVSNSDNNDSDRDGVGDACDNCMYYNPDQGDLNGNGIGDVCEAWYAAIDSDGDGMADRVDPCPSYYNGPVWLDGDGDGIPDDCDNCPLVSNPNQKDEDHEGIGDECETLGGGGCQMTLVEQPIYGIVREGVSRPEDVTIGSLGADTIYTRRLGEKLYELTDHLGNVRGVISNRMLTDIVAGVPGKYRADIRRYSNLYPYGMEMPGRYYAGSGYRYGYNGMEQDSSSTGDHYTTYFRQYDARLGRFWSVDPVTHSWESPYAAMGGNPIAMADPSGAEPTGTGGDKSQGGIPPEERGQPGGGKDNTSVNTPIFEGPTYTSSPYIIPRPEGETRWSNGELEYWHNEVDGTGYYQQSNVYHIMVDGLLDRKLAEPTTKIEDWGWRSDVKYAKGFYDVLRAVQAARAYVGPYFRGRWNPYFKGHGLESNDFELYGLLTGGWALGRLGFRAGAGYITGSVLSAEARPLALRLAADDILISNPLPANGVFSRVMPARYALEFSSGSGKLGGGEVFIGAADDLVGVTTIAESQKRLALYKDFDATVPNLGGDMVVQFKIRDVRAVGIRSPYETPDNPRGYGFIVGGRTAGGAREWLINNGTAEELGIYDIVLIPLTP